MLEVKVQQCEDTKYIQIAESNRLYIANAPQATFTTACGAFLFPCP